MRKISYFFQILKFWMQYIFYFKNTRYWHKICFPLQFLFLWKIDMQTVTFFVCLYEVLFAFSFFAFLLYEIRRYSHNFFLCLEKYTLEKFQGTRDGKLWPSLLFWMPCDTRLLLCYLSPPQLLLCFLLLGFVNLWVIFCDYRLIFLNFATSYLPIKFFFKILLLQVLHEIEEKAVVILDERGIHWY